MKEKLIQIAVALLLMVGAFIFGHCRGRSVAESSMKPEVITRVIHDTTRVISPIPKAEWIAPERRVLIPPKDTEYITVHDTTYIEVPYEVKEYSGNGYYAQIGGYHPELLKLEYNSATTTLGFKQKPHSVYAAVSGTYCGDLSTSAGVGYEYRDGRWAVGGEIGYEILLKKPAVELHASFDIFQW